VRVGRQIVRRGGTAVEHHPKLVVAHNGVAAVLEDGRARIRRGELERWRQLERRIVERRRQPIRALQGGCEALHARNWLVEPARVERNARFEQVAEHQEVIQRAPLVVTAVSKHLLRNLAPEKGEPLVSEGVIFECAARQNERARVRDHVVPEHLIFDVARKVTCLLQRARCQGIGRRTGRKRGCGDPVAQSLRYDVGMPRIADPRRVVRGPRLERES